MQIKAANVDAYIAQLPEDRREAIETLRRVINKHIDKKFEEGIQYGMIGYYLPHSVYPDGYHCDPKQPLPFASIASQKNHIGLYLFCIYTSPELSAWFCSEWKKSGKKLDMGKSCVRVKRLEDIPLDVLAQLFKRVKANDFVAGYEASLAGRGASRKPGSKQAVATQAVAKKAATKPATKPAKKPAAKPATKPATKAAKTR